MKRTRYLLAVAFLAIAFAPFQQACAEEFVAPTLPSIVKTLIRFRALDIEKDSVIDIYGQTSECAVYHKYFKDEFAWQRARAALRDSVRQKIAAFPVGYRYDTKLKLDRYDFQNNFYPLSGDNVRVNVFTISAHGEDVCLEKGQMAIPEDYRFVLDKPVQLQGLPLS